MLIFVEGIDKTGKDTLVRYINEISNYSHCVLSRGPVSTLAYSKKFNRKFDYNVFKDISNCIVIFLYAQIDDLDIRFSMNREPNINKQKDSELFENTVNELEDTYGINVMRFNTSYMTPYQISHEVLERLEVISCQRTKK